MAKNAPKAIPDGMNSVTVHLWFNGQCEKALRFYEKIFDARVTAPPDRYPGGKGILHAMIRLGDTNIMMADAWPGQWDLSPEEIQKNRQEWIKSMNPEKCDI